VLGWDAVGIVEAVGLDVALFRPGDEVFYAGSIARPGSDAELHLVDERIVGQKPRSLSAAAAAALPLTSITAWELLFDRLGVQRRDQAADGNGTAAGTGAETGSLLIVGGAGGVFWRLSIEEYGDERARPTTDLRPEGATELDRAPLRLRRSPPPR